jgi:hypothetical protein
MALSRDWKNQRRVDHYRERNFVFGWFKNAKTQPMFCMSCRNETCKDTSHHRFVLHPIIRIPRKGASKTKWKQFFEQVKQFHVL